MKRTDHLPSKHDWVLRVFAIEKARGIFQTSDETLGKIYEKLTDEQKIAFVLAGKVPSLLYSHQQHIEPMRTDSDTETGQLPVLC